MQKINVFKSQYDNLFHVTCEHTMPIGHTYFTLKLDKDNKLFHILELSMSEVGNGTSIINSANGILAELRLHFDFDGDIALYDFYSNNKSEISRFSFESNHPTGFTSLEEKYIYEPFANLEVR